MRRVFNLILHLSLLTLALIFVKSSVDEYMEAKTSFAVTQHSLTLNDIPTLVFCFKFAYKDSYNVSWTDFGEELKSIELGKDILISIGNEAVIENRTVTYSSGYQLTLTKFWTEALWNNMMPCIKFTSRGNEKDMSNFGDEIGITIEFMKRTPEKILLSVTTETNSYGWTRDRWMDGKTDVIQVDLNRIVDLKINEVVEYQYLSSLCSQDSYFECLAERFANFDLNAFLERADQEAIRGCSFERICSPVSLPFRNQSIPICAYWNERRCQNKILDNLKTDQHKHCKKTCNVKEFKVKIEDYGAHTRYNGSRFNCNFESSKATKELRTMNPFKTINREYYVISWMSLFGNVGGTLGIFIGFSFLSTTEWFASTFKRFLTRSRSRKLNQLP